MCIDMTQCLRAIIGAIVIILISMKHKLFQLNQGYWWRPDKPMWECWDTKYYPKVKQLWDHETYLRRHYS